MLQLVFADCPVCGTPGPTPRVCGRCGWHARSLNGEPSEEYLRDLEKAQLKWKMQAMTKVDEVCVIAPRERLKAKADPRFMSAAMVLVEGGTFRMGGTYDSARPIHEVTVSDFYIGKYPVTQQEYRAVMNGENPSNFKGDDLPVDSVSWYDAVNFCNALSIQDGLEEVYTIRGEDVRCDWGKNGCRLPTEAEWEYAARGGRKSREYEYAGSNDEDEVAWYSDTSGGSTHPVGKKEANELGLHDMSGNVWEWCWDWHGEYPSDTQTDPRGRATGSDRVLRGGSWGFAAGSLQVGDHRLDSPPSFRNRNLGFRPARTVP